MRLIRANIRYICLYLYIRELLSTGEESSSSGDDCGEGDGHAVAIVPAKPQATANHLLMVSLLEHLCTLYVPDVKSSKRLFKGNYIKPAHIV